MYGESVSDRVKGRSDYPGQGSISVARHIQNSLQSFYRLCHQAWCISLLRGITGFLHWISSENHLHYEESERIKKVYCITEVAPLF